MGRQYLMIGLVIEYCDQNFFLKSHIEKLELKK